MNLHDELMAKPHGKDRIIHIKEEQAHHKREQGRQPVRIVPSESSQALSVVKIETANQEMELDSEIKPTNTQSRI